MGSKNLGEILLEQGVIDREALDRALQLQHRRLGEILIEEQLADPVEIAQALKLQARSQVARHPGHYSIDSSALDSMLLRLEAIEDQIVSRSAAIEEDVVFASIVSLRKSIEHTLLMPAKVVFQKASWVLRQSAAELGKKVELRCEGGELDIDRALVGELSDVVLHLIRNAVDHGIEPAEVRLSRGKADYGTVTINIAAVPGLLTLSVSDDGGGIDEDSVYTKAVACGLLDASRDTMSAESLHHLLFTPGFSTRAESSRFSGRGVGLDVVEAAAIRLRGSVRVLSNKKQGAMFSISVPLPCARFTVLPLRMGDEWIAVNAAEVASIEEARCVAGLLSARSLFPLDSADTSFGIGAVKVKWHNGSCWAFEEVGRSEDVLVRESSVASQGANGVIGGVRLACGRSMLLVDLGVFESRVQPIGDGKEAD